MKEKMITLIKRVLMGFGGLFLILFILVAIFGSDTETQDSNLSLVTEPEVAQEVIKDEGAIAEEVKIEPTIWTINSEEFEWSKSPVQIWAKADPHSDGISKPVGQVEQYDKVEFLEQHKDRLYCKIKFQDITGFIACSWLEEAPQEWKDLWKL